jgi:hypothetical protein
MRRSYKEYHWSPAKNVAYPEDRSVMNDAPLTSRRLSNRTVAIIFGSVILILTAIFAFVGGGWVALSVPLGFLAAAIVIVFLQILFQMVILPTVALFVLGVARLAKLLRGER